MDYSKFSPFKDASYFHSYCPIKDYNNQADAEGCWLGDDSVSLPDLNTESEEVQKIWYDWIGTLVSDYSSKFLPLDLSLPQQKLYWHVEY